MSKILFVTHDFAFHQVFQRNSFVVSVRASAKFLMMVLRSLLSRSSGTNFPPNVARNSSEKAGSLSFSRSNLILLFHGLLVPF